MFSFCPHCGQSIDQEQSAGQSVVCIHCGKPIGVVKTAPRVEIIDRSAEVIEQGIAARCPLCQQLIEIKGRNFAPHFTASGQRKLCPQSGKPTETASAPIPAAKDLSHLMTRQSIRVVSFGTGQPPRIEELALAYLDKADRVRLQIEALREILGPQFRLGDYPAMLGRPHLAVWSSATISVVGRRHEHGGYETMSDAEITQVVADLRQHPELFSR